MKAHTWPDSSAGKLAWHLHLHTLTSGDVVASISECLKCTEVESG